MQMDDKPGERKKEKDDLQPIFEQRNETDLYRSERGVAYEMFLITIPVAFPQQPARMTKHYIGGRQAPQTIQKKQVAPQRWANSCSRLGAGRVQRTDAHAGRGWRRNRK